MIKIEINTENDAFTCSKEFECTRILRELINDIEMSNNIPKYHVLKDINGNNVGEIKQI